MAFEKNHYNYGTWTKGRFSEAVTVTGPAKMIFVAGIGSEHEETGDPLFKDDFQAQCRYAYKKLKAVVKQVTYVTDVRYWKDASAIRAEQYGDAPLPVHTFLNVNQLAFPGMLVEIDVIAMVPAT